MPTYTASDGSEWDMYCGTGAGIEEVLELIKDEPELWLPTRAKEGKAAEND